MKIKALIFLSVFSILAILSLSQFSVVSAQTKPVATSPITYFTYLLRGRITYRLLDSVSQIPASGVTVVAKNSKSGKIFYTKTNLNGDYTLTVNQASVSAQYLIRPNDGRKTQWIPAQYKLMVSKDINNLNFVGTPASPSAKTSR